MSDFPSIYGTDGNCPVFDPNGRWTLWALQDIYTGDTGLNKYVPKVNDYVVDYETDEHYKVIELDKTTLLARLEKINGIADGGDIAVEDLLLGPKAGTTADTYRVYIDKSVLPYSLTVDTRCRFGGSTSTYAQIFRGSKLDNTAEIVSGIYDQSGNLVGQNIPLELVSFDGNISIKVVSTCYTTQPIEDGEVLTVVIFSADGGVVSKRQILAEETTTVRKPNAVQKYITHITLDTPFLSEADRKVIQYPMNLPTDSFNMFGVVHYSDGSRNRLPVDGRNFQIFGLNNFVSTIIGQKTSLVLKYTLSAGELVYGADSISQRFLTESYDLITSKADGTYSMKLYGYPVWTSEVAGYRMDWWLMNLDRNELYHVTQHVTINDKVSIFQPVLYGVTQRLSVSINLKSVNGAFKNYIHTQIVDVSLIRPASDHTGTQWTIGFEHGQNPPFGRENAVQMTFVNQNLKKLDITLGESDRDIWLDRLFKQTKPLYNPATEIEAPLPNMFKIITPNGKSYIYRIDEWNTELVISDLLEDNATLLIAFFLRVPETDIMLSIAGVPVFQKDV